MSQEASHRCPIEIWRQIFRNVLVTSLLPSSYPHGGGAYDIISNITLFWESCPPSQEFRRVESARTALRLVCRSWNAQLDSSGAGGAFGCQFAITDLQEKHWPSPPIAAPSQIRRLQINTSEKIWCTCQTPCGFLLTWSGSALPHVKHSTDLMGGQATHPTPPLYKGEGLPNLQVLTVSPQGLSKDVIDILQSSSALTVLSLDVSPWSNGQLALTMALPGPFDKLLYLRLSGLSNSIIGNLQGDMFIPKLQLLELHFLTPMGNETNLLNIHDEPSSRDGKTPSPAASLARWRFPALQSLTICGGVETHLAPHLDTFVSHCARTLTNVALQYFPDGFWANPIGISPSLRRDFPRLLVYGANIKSLIKYVPSPTTPPDPLIPITILAEIDPEVIPGTLSVPNIMAHTKDALKACEILNCDRIVLLSSWEDLRVDVLDMLDITWKESAINRLRLFLMKIEDGGVNVSDRNAVDFGKGGDAQLSRPSHRGAPSGVGVFDESRRFPRILHISD